MSRREDRETAVKLIYEYMYYNGMNAHEFISDRESANECEYSAFVKEAFVGVSNAESEIDKAISELSNGWKISRMAKVTLAVLRLAAYEIIFTDTPAKAVINEALEIAKKYDDPKSTRFINGILNNLASRENKLGEKDAE